jgi:hypothetical protein
LKQVHSKIGISRKETNSFVTDISEKIAKEGVILISMNDKNTLYAREIQISNHLVLSGDFAKHTISEGG